MSDLVVAFDPSSSLSKGFYTLKPFQLELILIEPEVALVPQASIEMYEQNKVGNASPENSAWVECNGKYYALGFLARHQFYANLGLEELKFERAVYKVLGLVGAIAQKKSLPKKFSLSLGLLLPFSEYQDRKRFQRLVSKALSEFSFRGEKYSVNLQSFQCLPEGAGLLLRGRKPEVNLKTSSLALLMLGYRNASILLLERGELNRGETNELGFIRMVRKVQNQTSGQKLEQLTEAICASGAKVKTKSLTHLLHSSNSELRQEELSQLITAIKTARVEYWQMLANWLRSKVNQELIDEVILAGGTANYFQAELNQLFAKKQINWCSHLEERIINLLTEEYQANSLHYRLTDVYGFFFYLQQQFSDQESQELVNAV